MKFSIIIPAYNSEKYLYGCVLSVLCQTFGDYEIIIVNDGSNDKTGLICDDLLKKDDRIIVENQENKGLSSARNTGILHSKGEYILFLDSDDYLYSKEALFYLNEKTINNPDLIIFLPIEVNDNTLSIVKTHNIVGIKTDCVLDEKNIIDVLYSNDEVLITMSQTKLVKRKFVIENNLMFVDGIYHEDDEWIARLILSLPKTIVLNNGLYAYRHRAESIISTTDVTKTQKKINDKIFVASKMLENDSAKTSQMYVLYAIRYFLNACAMIKSLPKTYRNSCRDKIKECGNVFEMMKTAKSVKIRLLFIIKKIFGVDFAIRLIS